MEDTLFHKDDKIYMTSGKYKYFEGEVVSITHAADGGIYYSVVLHHTSGKGKNKKEEKYVLGGVTAGNMRKL